jgi:predicted DNA-binding mobile mystery protein A
MPNYRTLSLARRNLDSRLELLRNSGRQLAKPPRGWIRAIRESLGMTQLQLARRLGITDVTVSEMERSEAEETIQLATLRRAANALECDLVYAFVPREPLERRVHARSRQLAEKTLRSIEQSMKLEDQAVTDPNYREEQIRELIQQQTSSGLWDE